jgi:UDP-glucose 4-epimerase
MKVVVLGAGGFLGRSVIRALQQSGHELRLFDLRLPDECKRHDHLEGDFRDPKTLDRLLVGCPDAVVHLITTTVPVTAESNHAADVEGNLLGTLGLLDACLRNGAGRVVFPSSGGTVYGPIDAPADETQPRRPVCSYGIVKSAIEDYLALYTRLEGLDHVVLRIANAYGPAQTGSKGQGVIGAFLHRAMRGEPLEIWGDGNVVRDFVHVDDVARAVALAVEHPGPSRVFNVGTGVGTSLRQIVDLVEAVVGEPLPRRHRPQNRLDIPYSVLGIDRIAREMGWRPEVALADGVAEVYRSLQRAPRQERR